MKLERIGFVLAIVALTWPVAAAAALGYRIVTSAFVFKQSDFHSIQFSAEKPPGADSVTVLPSPSTLAFDGNSLALRGADFSWSAGAPPRPFNRIDLPAMAVLPNTTMEIRSAAPLQYLEKQADGSLQVRDIARDSPEVPHCHLRLTLKVPAASSDGIRLACDLDLTAISGRAAIPGVNLDVGRPVLVSFKNKIELAMRPGEWTAVQFPAAQGGDERLLLLVAAVLVRDINPASSVSTFPAGPDPYGWTGQGTPLPDSHQHF